ncbi:MAG TPA: hypothetical protein VLG16_04180 [Candidatus Saccharimonadales bacterium]|nr:hypothetical protein [Candidatus Saccharimonadales bacterium]
MLVMALVSWWYTAAWSGLARRIEQRLTQVLNFFSVGLLFRTLFDPFRQIAAAHGAQGDVSVQFKAWLDKLFSRCVGFVVRSIFIGIGIVSAIGIMIFGVLQLLLWPCVPLLPVVAVLGMAMGWKL